MIIPYRDLCAVKQQLGEIVFLDYGGLSLTEAHRCLGKEVAPQVQRHLRRRLQEGTPEHLLTLLFQARGCWLALEERLRSPAVPQRIRQSLAEYQACLEAWAEGTGLAGVRHPALRALCPVERAMFLQHDNSGCQTGMYRQADGQAVLWHTEEDSDEETGGRFDALRVAVFQAPGAQGPVKVYAFIYPDLLPGPAFGWRSDGYIQAVDLLALKHHPSPKPRLLANIPSWVTLFLGAQAPAGQVLEALGPYYDGYALNAIYVQDGNIEGHKHEFAYDLVRHQRLDDTHDSLLFQANAFSPGHSSIALRTMESLNPQRRSVFERREERTQAALDQLDAAYQSNFAPFLAKLLTSRRGGKRAYSNKAVKARLIARLGIKEAEIWLDGGPGIPGEPYHTLNYALP